jgi:hypothetical protein
MCRRCIVKFTLKAESGPFEVSSGPLKANLSTEPLKEAFLEILGCSEKIVNVSMK